MTYNEKTRGLKPKKGYALKEKNAEFMSDHEIFLSVFSKPSDFDEIDMEEFERLAKEMEEKQNADRHQTE